MIEKTCQDCEQRPSDLLVTRRQFLDRMGWKGEKCFESRWLKHFLEATTA